MIDIDNTYVTSDLHFYHKNIIKYCNRPYELTDEGVLKMNEDILKKFDELPDDCLVINNGDIVLKGGIKEEEITELVQRMKGKNRKLWLMVGNHDKETYKRLRKENETMIEFWARMGFDAVFPFPVMIEDNIEEIDYHFVFSHEPIGLYGDKKSNIINIYGHTHDKVVSEEDYYINVCWDYEHRIIPYRELIEKKKYYKTKK